jgi:hypothetical protein
MTKGFLLLVLSVSAIAFAGTWLVTGESSSSSSGGTMKVAGGGKTDQISTCEEAVEQGLAPMYAGTPGYRADLDPDGDGLACPPA